MAHEIHENDHLFFVGKTPWHGLGTELPSLATAQEAIEAARLNWTVTIEPQVRKGIEIPGKNWTVRDDTDTVLGVVGDQYRVLQNEDAFRFFDAVTQDPHGPKYEVAGSLWNGRKVWLLAKLPDVLEVVPGDIVEPYILLSNSHDGSSAIRIMETPIRVVCQNTLNMAHSGQGRSIKVRHSGDIMLKVNRVQDALGIIRQTFAETLEVFQALAKVEPTAAQVERVLTTLFPDTKTDRAKLQRERVMSLADHGKGNERVAGSAWGLYNGITELVDHVNNAAMKDLDSRLNILGMGSGLDAKADALQTIIDTCLN
jgi:phage/plasmid-like protein (TIGR03299 family)